jgi:uncharacterized membrane protein
MEQIGKTFIIIGIILVIAGLIIYFAGNKFGWLGQLPGDINIVKNNVRIFIPLTTMILISVVLSLILYLIRKFFDQPFILPIATSSPPVIYAIIHQINAIRE